LYGIGKFFFNSLEKEFQIEDFPFIFIIGLLISAFIAIFLNFFFPINYLVTSIFIIISSMLGIFYIFYEKNIKSVLYIFLLSFIVFILVYKSTNVVDFGLYHAPYIGIINSEKIVIGLTNIHFRFGYSSIIQNAMAIYNIPLFFPKNYLTLTSIFFTSIFLFYFFYLLDQNNFKNRTIVYLFNFFVFIFICVKVYRYNDFGNDMLSNLITFFIWSKILEFIFYKSEKIYKNEYNIYLILLLVCSILATFNKVQFALSILPIFILFIKNFKLFKFDRKHIYFVSIIIIILTSIFFRNFLISGCFQYPMEITCSEKVSWTTKNTKSITDAYYNYQKGQAWAKDWPNRIKRANKNEINTYEEYNKIKNWLPVWMNNHFKRIIEKNIIYVFIIIFLILYLYKNKIKVSSDNYNWYEISLVIISLICTLLWFLKFPIYRYGYSYILISILIPFLLYFKNYHFKINIFINLKKFVVLFAFVFFMLNFTKIYKNYNESDWPNVFQDAVDDDYIIKINDKKIKVTTADVCYYEKIICTNFIPPKNLKVTYFKNYTIINSNLQYHGAW